jgi:hypothetical protein
MSDLVDILEAILDVGDLWARYGIRGCITIVLVVAAVIVAIVVLAAWLA